ncbi:MAG: CinA family nicotinamide mononucleotide deamidase-related protein [Planctomycetales bacterium]
MRAETIAIGTELTTGAKLDTNSQWLSLELAAVGIPVHFHTTVADDLEANVQVLQVAAQRADIVVITGGLGPTLDDLTRDALARLLGVPLVQHEPSLAAIRAMFARRGREMPQRNVVQAMFPDGTEPIPNSCGTAPGVLAFVRREGRGDCLVAAMPGVPSEMRVMFRDSVLPRLDQFATKGRIIRHARINCFGLGESAAEELLGDVTARGRDPEVGITVHEATITLRIVAEGATLDEVRHKIDGTKRVIYERMGEYAYGEEDEELEHVVVRELSHRGMRLAVFESVTGGLIAHRLTDVPGHERCFLVGNVAPWGAGVDRWLKGNATALGDAGPISLEAARDLARAYREELDVEYALAVSDCTHLDFRETAHFAPRVFVALADREQTDAREINVAGDPAILKSRVAKAALNLLRLRLRRG